MFRLHVRRKISIIHWFLPLEQHLITSLLFISLVEEHGAIKIKNEIDSIWNEAIQTHGFVNSCPVIGAKKWQMSFVITKTKKLQLSNAANKVKKTTCMTCSCNFET